MTSDGTGDELYIHYETAFRALGEDEAVCIGSIARNVHDLAKRTLQWEIPEDGCLLSDWQFLMGSSAIYGGVEERARWILDSAVGNLLRLPSWLRDFHDDEGDERIRLSSLPSLHLPDPNEVWHNNRLAREWARELRSVIVEIQQCDTIQQQRIKTVAGLRYLLLRCYLVIMALHMLLTVVDDAAASTEGS